MNDKRFELHSDEETIDIIDLGEDEVFNFQYDVVSLSDAKRLVRRLNLLNEENDELKQQLKTKVIVNKQYEELQRLKKENNHLKDDFQYYMSKSATLETELLRLRKENERLNFSVELLSSHKDILIDIVSRDPIAKEYLRQLGVIRDE